MTVTNELRALANMVNYGKGFLVVQTPDYEGGHQFEIALPGYVLKAFEYVAWEGTPKEFFNQEFVAHVEPYHDEPYDFVVSHEGLLKKYFQL